MACCKSRAFCSLGGNHTQASARVPRQIFPVKTSRNSYTAFCNSSHCVQMDPDPAERAVEVDPVDALAAEPPKIVKRKVAMHIGYVGTGYRGLQFSKDEGVKTIEKELIEAIHKAGLITDANKGDLHKLKWSRSSRTDKGVHSLSTVVALKIMMDETQYDSDPEGIQFADQITKHLSPQLKVFSVQRVNKHFRARHLCTERSYRYYLPVALLTGKDVKVGSSEQQEALEKFRKALSMFVGRHPFHNFTKLKNYKDNPWDMYKVPQSVRQEAAEKSQDTSRVKNKPKRAKRTLDEDSSDSENSIDGIENRITVGDDSTLETSTTSNGQVETSTEFPVSQRRRRGGLMYGELTESEKATGRFRFWNFQFKEREESEKDGDAVVLAHYRTIKSFTASDPELTSTDGVWVVCCEVVGMSFMLHQIRYMIAAAIAVSRGFISYSVLEAALSLPMRLNLPMAPPQPLMLADCEFQPFPLQGQNAATVSKWSGERLMLRGNGRQSKEKFTKDVVLPAIGELLKKPEWDRWSTNLHLFAYHEGIEEVDAAMELYRPWVASMAEKKETKQKMLEEKGIDNTTYWKWKKEVWRNHGEEVKKKAMAEGSKGPVKNEAGTSRFWGWLQGLLPLSKS